MAGQPQSASLSDEVTYGRADLSDFTVHYNDGSGSLSVHVNRSVLAHLSSYFDGIVSGLVHQDSCQITARCTESNRFCVTLPDERLGHEKVSCAQLQQFFDILHNPTEIFKTQLIAKSKLGEWRSQLKPGDIVQFAHDRSQYFYRDGHPTKMDWIIGTVTSIKNGRATVTSAADEDTDGSDCEDDGMKKGTTESDVNLDRLQPFGDDSRVRYSYELSDFLIVHQSIVTIAHYFECNQLLSLYQAHLTTLHCEALDRFQSEPLWVLLMLADKCNWTHLVDILIPLLSTDKNCDKRPAHLRRTVKSWEDMFAPLSTQVKARLFVQAL